MIARECTPDLELADRMITEMIREVYFCKTPAANEIEMFQRTYRMALEKALNTQYLQFEELDLTGDLSKLMQQAHRILGPDLVKKLEPDIKDHLFKAFRAGQALRGIPERIRVRYTEAHQGALDWLIKHDQFWLGRVFPVHVQDKFKAAIVSGIKDGFSRREIADQLHGLMFGQVGMPGKKELYHRVVTANVSRARNWGGMFSMEAAGVETFVWRAVGDERTCSRCRYMDGLEFNVSRMMDQIRTALSGPVEAIEELAPWPGHDRARDDYYIRTRAGRQYLRGKPTTWLQDHGIGSPPLHAGCRCVLQMGGG